MHGTRETRERRVSVRSKAWHSRNTRAPGSGASVSDRLDDLQHSVYSVGAAMERRIEIEQVVGR